MTDEQKTTREESRTPFEDMPFEAMMQKMMNQMGSSFDCTEMMSHMMTMCRKKPVHGEKEKSTTETTKNK